MKCTDILNETYYGKNPELIQCEEYLKEMKEYLISGKNPNNCPAKAKFETTMANLFGFEKVFYSFIADERFENGFTVPYFWESSRSEKDNFFDLVKSKYGIRYKYPKGKYLYVYTYNYSLRNTNVEGLMAVFLHEVGHNFFLTREQIAFRKTKWLSNLVMEALIYLDQNNWNPALFKEVVSFLLEVSSYAKNGIQASMYNQYKQMLEDKMHEKVISKEERNSKGLGKILSTAGTVVSSIFSSLFTLPITATMLLLMPLLIRSTISSNAPYLKKNEKKYQDYNAEKFCDNFAAAYGYSVGIANMFSNTQNMSKRGKVVSKIPLFNIIDYFNETISSFVFYFNDPHPDSKTRVVFMLNKLKHELEANKNYLNPHQVAEIEEQIDKIEKLISKAPLWKKLVDGMFDKHWAKRDEIATQRYTNDDIYDFEKDILKPHIKKESSSIEYLNSNLQEDFDINLSRYLDSKNNEPFLEESAQLIFDKLNGIER